MLTPSILINRRRLLGTAAASGAALALGAPPALAEQVRRDPTRTPQVLAAAGRAGRVQSPGFAVHHLGLSWSGPERAGRVRLRYADGWRAWQPLLATDLPRLRPAPLAVLRRGRLGVRIEPAAGVTGLRISAINTVDGPDTGTTRDRVRRWTGLTYLTRAGWGADESLRFNPDGTEKFPPAFFDVQTLTVHHTVTANSDPDPAATVRAIYFFYSITEDFGDIGYHLLVDQAAPLRGSTRPDRSGFGPRSVGPRPRWCQGPHRRLESDTSSRLSAT